MDTTPVNSTEEDKAIQDDKMPLYKRLRNTVFPIKPEDSVVVKGMKHAGFTVFAVIFGVVSLVLALAISFAL